MINLPHSGCYSRHTLGRATGSRRSRLVVRAEKGLEAGSRVRVTESVIVYHAVKNSELDLKGWEGTIEADTRQVKGTDLTATFPWVVVFERPEKDAKRKNFKAHLKEHEFEVIG